jgi:signal transduction histidine kinase
MKGLITDLLNVSRMASGNFKLEFKEVDLQKIVSAEVEFAKPLAKTQQVELNYHQPTQQHLEVLCDENKLRQVIVNFITNAINYSPKGHVDVYLLPKLDSVEFRVVDDGIGVPEDQKAKLFQKFFRAENAKKERPSGSGIGLFLAKRVVDEHGGNIIFKSTQGHGSTFGFVIPTKPAVKQEPATQAEAAVVAKG